MDSTYGVVAEHFTKLDETRLNQLVVLPPYEPKGDSLIQWVRGSIRLPLFQPDGFTRGGYRDLVVTGPRMKVVYGGCRYNRINLALPGAGVPEVYEFERWIRSLMSSVKGAIWYNPSKYRVGATSSARFQFNEGVIRPSTDPSMYPDELVVRLSTKKELRTGTEPEEYVDTELIAETPTGVVNVHHEDIRPNSTIIPIIKVSYNRNIETFGIVLTLLKAKVFEPDASQATRIDNYSWSFDEPMEY